MPIDWKAIAKAAAEATDEEFKNKMSSLTRFNDAEIEHLITDTGISKVDLVEVLKQVKDATKSNEAKAQAISNINKGVNVLIGIASKLV